LSVIYNTVFTQFDEWDDAGHHAHGVGTISVLQQGNGTGYGFSGYDSKGASFVCGTSSIVLGTYSNYENNAFVL